MCENKAGFDFFEHEFIELVGEFQSLAISESHLREALRKEATRAEAAAADRDASERSAREQQANAAAAAAGAAQATKALAAKQNELLTIQTKLDVAERERSLLQEKYTDMIEKSNLIERELKKLRPLQATQINLQRQYTELQERIESATSDARSEASKLENELRRVERCASAGSEVRERARLAAAAHARERRLAAAEMQQASHELKAAHVEIARLGVIIAELNQKLSNAEKGKPINNHLDLKSESVDDILGALEAERAGCARLEKALAAAVADNASLAAQLRSVDNSTGENCIEPQPNVSVTNICPIDSFLAD